MSDNGPDYSKYILPAALALIAYGIYQKFFGTSSSGNLTTNNLAVSTSTEASVAASLAQSVKTAPAILTQAQATAAANTIFQLGLSFNALPSTTQDQIMWQILQVDNLTDLLMIIQAFGTKDVSTSYFSYCNIFGLDCTKVSMPTFLHMVLDGSHINEINTYLSDTNINYQF